MGERACACLRVCLPGHVWGVSPSLTLCSKPALAARCKTMTVLSSSQLRWVRNSGRGTGHVLSLGPQLGLGSCGSTAWSLGWLDSSRAAPHGASPGSICLISWRHRGLETHMVDLLLDPKWQPSKGLGSPRAPWGLKTPLVVSLLAARQDVIICPARSLFTCLNLPRGHFSVFIHPNLVRPSNLSFRRLFPGFLFFSVYTLCLGNL